MRVVQRLLAALLIASLSLPLAAAFVRTNAEAELPACCRRDGKHACAMMKRPVEPAGASTAVASKKLPCAQYPSGKAVPASVSSAFPIGLIASTPPPTGVETAAVQEEILLRISPARTSPKRGPPSVLPA